MKIGDIVIAPEGCQNYLTAGKEYKVEDVISENGVRGCFFRTTSDCGREVYTSEINSTHLNGNDWILKPTTHEKVKDDKTIKK